MDPQLLKLCHLIGAFCLFLGFGGILAIGENRTNINKLVASLNGAGLLILFLTGFASQGVQKFGFPGWLVTKMVLWVALVLLFVFAKKGKIPAKIAVLASLAIGAFAAYLCLLRPF